ncbi:hypothetical protein ACQ33O_03785 [Ferruginibacter sp. SUN002]|uniref:hypothetical protein n=1 Tax=Ferruginibacter sp. SUN002 TaxID=2937789 RepID=UPI003D36CD9A
MKKIKFFLVATCLSLTILSLQANASNVMPTTPLSDSAQANVLLLRLYEINSMDKTNLSTSDKKVLRKEVQSINSSLKSTSNGVYLSIGAVIIIILLLILLV